MDAGLPNWPMEASRTLLMSEISNGRTHSFNRTLTFWKGFNNVWISQKKYSFLDYVTWKESQEKAWRLQTTQSTSKFIFLWRLAVVCIFIAQKFYSDFHYDIEDFSISSGVKIKDILKLETFTLELLEYNLILTERDYYGVLLFGKFWISNPRKLVYSMHILKLLIEEALDQNTYRNIFFLIFALT